MIDATQIWKLLAGLAIFLLGMKFLEEALQAIAGRSFKLFLKKQTSSKIKAVTGGAVVTAILQSSSVVNLMVLAFVGAGIIQMQNALAIVFGANLGTTLGSWIVATVGFKFDLEMIAFPFAGIFGILMLLTNVENKWHRWSKFLFGFGFLFTGLDFVKTSMEEIVKLADFSILNQYPLIVFLLLGFIITSIIQSSTATMAIVLSGLHANVISLLPAMAIVLGSEVGTSIKLVLASLNGIPAKKQVAAGNIFFNLISTTLAFIFLRHLYDLIKVRLQISDNLISLVLFQTLVNVFGIILFYPFLTVLGKWLERKFKGSASDTLFIHKVDVKETELAMTALENEVRHFILQNIHFTLDTFNRPVDELVKNEQHENNHKKTLTSHYDYLKQLHGETHNYAIKLQNSKPADHEIIKRLEQLVTASRNNMYAAKSIKDAITDIKQLSNSSNDMKYTFYLQAADKIDIFCRNMIQLLLVTKKQDAFKPLCDIYESVTLNYSATLKNLYRENTYSNMNEIEISTLINFNREMYTACKSYVFAVKEFLLNEKDAAYFDELPGFIR